MSVNVMLLCLCEVVSPHQSYFCWRRLGGRHRFHNCPFALATFNERVYVWVYVIVIQYQLCHPNVIMSKTDTDEIDRQEDLSSITTKKEALKWASELSSSALESNDSVLLGLAADMKAHLEQAIVK